MWNELEKKQLRMCLDCKIGREFIREYSDLYEMIENEKNIWTWARGLLENEIINLRDLLKDVLCEDEIKKVLKMSAMPENISQLYYQLKNFSDEDISLMVSYVIFDERGKENIKLLIDLLGSPEEFKNKSVQEKYAILKQMSGKKCFDEETWDICIVNLQRIIYNLPPLYDEENLEMMEKRGIPYIIQIMNELNENKITGYEKEPGEEALKLYPKCKENEKDREKVKKIFRDIFNYFCYEGKEIYTINTKYQCSGKLFMEAVKQGRESTKDRTEFYGRISKLNDRGQKIIIDYIQNAPKYFGANIQAVMQHQGMSEQDIAIPAGLKPNVIQSLKTAKNPKGKYIRLVSRMLLVSENVLYRGCGKIFGNWKPLLEGEGIQAIAEIEKIKGETSKSTINRTKKFIRDGISDLIRMKQEEWEAMIKENPDLFEEKEYFLYEDHECFEVLLNQDEAFILLEVLERMETTE